MATRAELRAQPAVAQGRSLYGAEPGPIRQVATGGLWTAATWVLTLVTGPTVTVLLVRSMTTEQFGRYALAASAIGVLAILSAFGLEPAVARFAAIAAATPQSSTETSDPPNKADAPHLRGIALARRSAVAAGLLVGAVAVLAGPVPSVRPVLPALALSAPVAVLAPFKAVYGGTLRAAQRPVVVSVAAVASSVAFALLVTVGVLAGRVTAPLAAVALSFESVVCTGVLRCGVARRPRRGLRSGRQTPVVAGMAGFAAAVLLTGVFSVAVAELDVVVLGLSRGTKAVAAYAPASMIANGVLGMPAILGAFFLPAASRVVTGGDRDDVAVLFHWASRWNLALCAPAIGVLVACPGSVLTVLFGSHVVMPSLPLRLLGLGAGAQVGFGFNGLTLDAYGLAGVVARRQLASLVVSLALCGALIPVWGATGAATATASALLIANLLCSRSLFVRGRIRPWDTATAVLAVVSGLSVAAAWALGSLVDPGWTRLAVSGGIVTVAVLAAALWVSDPRERASIWYGLTRPKKALATVGAPRV